VVRDVICIAIFGLNKAAPAFLHREVVLLGQQRVESPAPSQDLSQLLENHEIEDASGGNLLGVVLNKVDAKGEGGYGYYGTYYDYYSNANGEEQEQPAPAAAGKKNGHPQQAPAEHEAHREQY